MAKLESDHPWGWPEKGIACRPIFSRLPAENYGYRTDETEESSQDPSNWISSFYDELLCGLKFDLNNFYHDYLDCQTAKAEVLDWAAQLYGFTGEHWDPTWEETFKRQLLCHAFEIWQGKGTEELFDWLLETYGIITCTDPKKIWQCENFTAGESRLDWPIKGNPLEAFIRVPLGQYTAKSSEWKLILRWIRLYMPIWAITVLCFCYFYAGHSRAGDGVFDHVLERSQGLVPLGENLVESFYFAHSDLAQESPLEYFVRLLRYLSANLGLANDVQQIGPFVTSATTIPALALNMEDWGENPGVFMRVDPAIELYQDYAQTWRDRERLVQLYRPYQGQWEINVVCHDFFRAGVSAPGHPVFDSVFLATIDAAKVFYQGREQQAQDDPWGYLGALLIELIAVLEMDAVVVLLNEIPKIEFALGNGTWEAITQARSLFELYQPYHTDSLIAVGYDAFYVGFSQLPSSV
ncbi:MAG TPA: phage tail protein [Vampirovibrionales bacterium]